jgi:hypothetical protein
MTPKSYSAAMALDNLAQAGLYPALKRVGQQWQLTLGVLQHTSWRRDTIAECIAEGMAYHDRHQQTLAADCPLQVTAERKRDSAQP